jgi:hypothetical protein
VASEDPFRFRAPIEPSELVGRDEELDRLVHLASSGTYALLDAPRRFGKASLLNALIEQWSRPAAARDRRRRELLDAPKWACPDVRFDRGRRAYRPAPIPQMLRARW